MPTIKNNENHAEIDLARLRPSRIIGIDVARSIAILLAMGSHVWTVSRIGDFYEGRWVEVLRIGMAAATPTFIILFGTMLEIVYLPRFTPGRRSTTSAKLLSRAVQCWLLYALSVLVLFLVHDSYSAMFSVATILMLGVTPFTDILKFYSIVLILAPILLWARCRLGLIALVVAAVAVHLAYPLLITLPTPTELKLPTEIDRLWKFLFGLGEAQLGGPSVMHGISLVIIGMAIGRALIGAFEALRDDASLRRRATIILVSAGAPLAFLFVILDENTIHDLGNMSLRIAGHPLYFFVGMLFACVLTTTAVLVTTLCGPSRIWRFSAFLGRTSLFTFSFGNILLYCMFAEPENRSEATALAVVLILAIILLSFWFDRTMHRTGWISHRVKSTQQMITEILETACARVAWHFQKKDNPNRIA